MFKILHAIVSASRGEQRKTKTGTAPQANHINPITLKYVLQGKVVLHRKIHGAGFMVQQYMHKKQIKLDPRPI